MQAPKDGDSPAYLTELHGMQKRLDDPATIQDRGDPRETFVTRNRDDDWDSTHKAFMRGFVKGMHPLRMADVLASSAVNSDVTVYTHGKGVVRVSGLALLQATDPELLGVCKGEDLRQQVIGQGVGLDALALKKQVEAAIFGAVVGVPVPKVVGWSGGGSPEGSYGVVTLDIEGAPVRYVPERTRGASGIVDFDHWYASPYTKVYERQQRELHARVNEADMMLSRVLHELAGEASLCWEPKPVGVFAAEQALAAVERAIGELRGILRGA